MWWWICGFSCIFTVVAAVVGFFALLAWEKRGEAATQAMLKEKGQVVKAWIVFANDQLYRVNNPRSMLPAQVVFTVDGDVRDLDQFLSAVAEEIREFETIDEEDDEERIIGQVVRGRLEISFLVSVWAV
jgi:hypothetical protein